MAFSLRPYKKAFDYSYTLGVFATIELLERRPQDVIKIYLSSRGSKNAGVEKIRQYCLKRRLPLEQGDRLIVQLSGSENTYALGVFRKFAEPLKPKSNHLLLDHPSDMGNVGTIIRTMLGFNWQDLAIIRPGVDVFDPKVVRASQGAIFQLRLAYYDHLAQYQAQFHHHLYPFMLMPGAKPLAGLSPRAPFTLVFGNEGAGLHQDYAQAGTPIKIAHNERIDSLNVAMAAGIALYELSKK